MLVIFLVFSLIALVYVLMLLIEIIDPHGRYFSPVTRTRKYKTKHPPR